MTNKTITIKEALKAAKPFVGSLAGKPENWSRPVLKTALVTEEYVIATDSHRLIRIKHQENVTEPYLHHYKETKNDIDVKQYPQAVHKWVPNPLDAKASWNVPLNEWIEGHDLGLIAAKSNNTTRSKNNVISLLGDKLSVSSNGAFDSVGFNYKLPGYTTDEKTNYNCKYMLDALKVFKKLKATPEMYFYGPLRPFLLASEGIEVIILPVRQ